MYYKYVEMHGDEENQQLDIHQLDQRIQLLQQWIDHHDEKGKN